MIASIAAKFIVLTRLFRHLLNWNGLRMFQISAKINLKIKNEWESQRAADMEMKHEGNMYSWHKKIYSIISFVSGFFLDVSAAKPISVFSVWSFRFDVFLLLEELLSPYTRLNFLYFLVELILQFLLSGTSQSWSYSPQFNLFLLT